LLDGEDDLLAFFEGTASGILILGPRKHSNNRKDEPNWPKNKRESTIFENTGSIEYWALTLGAVSAGRVGARGRGRGVEAFPGWRRFGTRHLANTGVIDMIFSDQAIK
jgi:hypothetical protein